MSQYIGKSLPCLLEDERIYLNVPYAARGFAKAAHCGFDQEKKLWFCGLRNKNLKTLIDLYEVNEITSEKAKQTLREKMME